MRSVFQVVATMVLANAAVAYGADAKSAVSAAKKGANATVEDAKAKAADVAKGAQTQATEVKATATDAAKDSTKQANASQPAAQPAATPASEVKEAAKSAAGEIKAEGKEVAAATGPSLIIPESAVLPAGVVRVRGVIASGKATKGFDRDSKSIDLGATIKATGGAGVLEFAINDKISGQILVPFRSAANFAINDAAKFREYVKQTSAYKDFYAQGSAALKAQLPDAVALQVAALTRAGAKDNGLTDAQADALAAQAKTKTAADVTAAIAANQPIGFAVPLAAYGLGPIGATENINDGIDRVLLDAGVATASSKGIATGIGDIEIGAKYALSTEKDPLIEGVPFYASVGLGVRLNSSHFKSAAVDNKTATGRGTTDLGLRLNADYNIINGLQLQLENQSEMMIQKGKTYKPAAVGGFIKDYDTGKLYTTATDVDYERTGMRQVGYAKLVLAPGAFSSSLNALKVNAKYSYDLDAKVKVDGVEQKDDATKYMSATVGVGVDGLQMGIPVQADIDYVMPMGGRNVGSASTSTVGTLKLFYKF